MAKFASIFIVGAREACFVISKLLRIRVFGFDVKINLFMINLYRNNDLIYFSWMLIDSILLLKRV